MAQPAKKKQWALTARDLEILEFLTRFGAGTADQVRREFFGDSLKPAYRRLRAMEQRGLLSGDRLFYNMPGIYQVKEQGARLSGVDLPAPKRDLARLTHTLELVELSYWVRREGNPARYLTERELRQDQLRERRDAQTGRMRRSGKPAARIPDAMAITEADEQIGLELELTPKRAKDYHKIFEDYARQFEKGETDRVRFYFVSEPALQRVSALANQHKLGHALSFYLYTPSFEFR